MTGYRLTRATLAPQAASLAALLADSGAPDGGHRLVWTLFPGEPDAKRDFLYRSIDERTFLILSKRPPPIPTAFGASRRSPTRPSRKRASITALSCAPILR